MKTNQNHMQRDKTRLAAKSDRKAHYDLRKERKAGKRQRAALEWCA